MNAFITCDTKGMVKVWNIFTSKSWINRFNKKIILDNFDTNYLKIRKLELPYFVYRH
jgi:hypothetical protein